MKKRTSNKTKLLVLLMLLVVTIGYALVSSNLSFSGLFGVKAAKWDIHFDNVSDSSSTITPVKAAEIDENDDKKINFSVNLDKPLDSYSFTADVVNAGTINGIVEEINLEGIEGNAYADYIDFTYSILKQGDVIKAGSSKSIKVSVSFKDVDSLPETYENNTFDLSVSIKVSQSTIEDLPTTASTLDVDVLKNSSVSKIQNIVVTTQGIPSGADVVTGFISKAFMMGVGADNTYVDISEEKDGSIVMWTEGLTMYLGSAKKGYKVRAPKDCTGLFSHRRVVSIDVTYLDVSGVENMTEMFSFSSTGLLPRELLTDDDLLDVYHSYGGVGTSIGSGVSETVETTPIIGLETWDVSNVTNMSHLFDQAFDFAYDSDFLESIENWDVSSVENMSYMFYGTFSHAEYVELNLNNWDTSNLNNISNMFGFIGGHDAKRVTLNVSEWNTSNVADMSYAFCNVGYPIYSRDVTCDEDVRNRESVNVFVDVTKWNTHNVTSMNSMFYSDTSFAVMVNQLDLSGWDVSNVTNYFHFVNENYSNFPEAITQPNWAN